MAEVTPRKLSKEDLRAARLRAMGLSADESSPGTSVEQNGKKAHSEGDHSPPSVSTSTSAAVASSAGAASTWIPLDRGAWRVLHEGGGATAEDIKRWLNQGFEFSSTWSAGLRQGQGGPCGVLAVVQAEMLVSLMFRAQTQRGDVEKCSPEAADEALVAAMLAILDRARSADSFVFVDCTAPDAPALSPSNFIATRVQTKGAAEEHLRTHIARFKSRVGCLLFLLAAAMTHGLAAVVADMDEDTHTLVGQFGHCSQETINLLLTGRASSNVFDGDIPLGESGLLLKGVHQRCSVGYLTQLEAIRLCQVGNYLKKPVYPVWVVGSSSHFTVLFCKDPRVNQESAADELLSCVQRAFKNVDREQCGFIAAEALEAVLLELDLLPSADPTFLPRLKAHLLMDGGIVLWSSLWEAVSRLMTGSSLDLVLGGAAASTRQRSDSEVARAMQEEMDGPSARPRSDSDLAREMQDKWEKDEHFVFADAPSPSVPMEVAEAKSESSVFDRSMLHRNDSIADESAECSVLYHFNGMSTVGHPPRLVKFNVYLRSSQSAVGQQTSLDEASFGGSAFSAPCEEVLRTRWPGCRIDYLGQPAPLLD